MLRHPCLRYINALARAFINVSSDLQFVLWRDVLNQHAKVPLHAMVGGGDQIYNDEVFSGKHVQEWLQSGRKVSTKLRLLCLHSHTNLT